MQRKVTKTERYGISNRVATSKAQAKREDLQRLATVERSAHESEDADLPLADEEVRSKITLLDRRDHQEAGAVKEDRAMHVRGERLASVANFITWMRDVDYIARPESVTKDYVKPKANAAELLKMRTRPETKVCRVCKEEKPASEFNVAPSNTDGLQGLCRECARKQRRKYYLRTHR